MVGQALCQSLSEHEIVTFPKWQMNIGNFDQVKKIRDIDFIVHLAGETDHEYCEANPTNCYYINTIATGNLARLARDRDIPILYLSTASVFDGKKEMPYTMYEEPNPINHYNASKWYGEKMVSPNSKHFIYRAGWMFGGGKCIDKKFVQKVFDKLERGHSEIKVCDDCIGSPTYTNDLALMIKEAISGNLSSGTYHAVNSCGGVSRYEVALKMIEFLGSDCEIIPCKIDDLKSEFPCKRTNYEVLTPSFPWVQTWEQALEGYINAHYKHL